MEDSILRGTKKMIGLSPDDPSYDHDVTTHINGTFFTLTQLGLGPQAGFVIEGEDEKWTDFSPVPANTQAYIKVYVGLKVRLLFDPPATSYLQTAMEKQITEIEWRLNVDREGRDWTEPDPDISRAVEAVEENVIIDGGGP